MAHQHSLDCLVRDSNGELQCAHQPRRQRDVAPPASVFVPQHFLDFPPNTAAMAPEPSPGERSGSEPTDVAVLETERPSGRARASRCTDVHRVGAIVPRDYSYVLSYSFAPLGGSEKSVAIDCDEEGAYHDDGSVTRRQHLPSGKCCLAALHRSGAKFASAGDDGKCSVCGARYRHGDVWRHNPTGEHIHLGHDCASKYKLLVDRTEWEMRQRQAQHAAQVAASLATGNAARAKFLADHPELEADLALADRHPILKDLAAKFVTYWGLSPKQVAFAHKLAEEVRNPSPPKAEEATIPAPEGKAHVRGRIISYKLQETDFGSAPRMTVKVETPAGYWLAWGTVPGSIMSDPRINELGKRVLGSLVEFDATLLRGREPHFALFKRPTKGKVLAVRPDVLAEFEHSRLARGL